MQQFIPFEDDWDALENLRPEDLIPYRVGLLDKSGPFAQRTVPTSPSIFSSSPTRTPTRFAVPADSSST
ncbi:hypothetical protein SAMN05428972_3567 [Rhodanobacter sp. OK091]|nr:hypothetical protein SAMN05428972_3567 [Rhodanobacter sp. OK091]